MQTAPSAPATVRTITPLAFDVEATRAILDRAAVRREILADRSLHEAIRAVVRLRGVPPQDVEDVLDTVVEQALEDENLPLDDEDEARRYLVGCARNKAIDAGRARKRKKEREVGADDQPSLGLSPDQQAFAARLVCVGEARFPRAFLWFLRNLFGGESHAAIAMDVGLSTSYVRAAVAGVRVALRQYGSVVATLFVIFIGMRYWRIPGTPDPEHHRDLATTASTAPRVPPAPTVSSPEPAPAPTAIDRARTLRRDAREKFAAGAWDKVVEELDEAYRLDPRGETDDDAKLFSAAQQKLDSVSKP